MNAVDCIVAGAGVIGLAVARALARAGSEVLVLEAQHVIGNAASSRNSEVIHAGIYYPAGSLKARLCVAGRRLLYDYCAARGIAHRRVGKLIVATCEEEIGVLQRYAIQASANGVDELRWLTADELRELEPQLNGTAGLCSPATGILDSRAFMLALQADLEAAGGAVVLRTAVTAVRSSGEHFVVEAAGSHIPCRRFINAAGLQAPDLARRIEGLSPALVPPPYFARGQYYALQGRAPFRHLVYPVAGPAGLGIHVTLDLAGAVRFGPDVQWLDGVDYGFDDTRRDAFITAIRRYYPALDAARLQPAYTGVRAKIAGPGMPPADFLIQGPREHHLPGLVNLFGIESPGLTASLAIAGEVRELLGCAPV